MHLAKASAACSGSVGASGSVPAGAVVALDPSIAATWGSPDPPPPPHAASDPIITAAAAAHRFLMVADLADRALSDR
jgi:hypothetical protein